ncbi:MAG: Bifunctional protein FolD [Candidatus Woesebacteria bacterium GW2011_GWB1_43_14]|uniref:Bifunctional protein FolD n=1 Tax=Candidatus Woesebacteria bacterium GW2011_GWB1_43_14 TaxID=1618578 RepID=A0A0G1GDI6_9BACT|nr:MAG: Bifunctional protein FolD [Candidatus Woesebacteria bacterium GW2011_GWA1_39_11b]KKS77744.1 MAG: Bifunctional protein folD [Candidatus Woesebacteria bacterium GW2011_GWC1_42_9]KKS96948.1 MAG: Bifunctional protein FolD [Candidatus Woesebacteria bacterium GW2011_GWB1_43_14]
MKTVVFNGKEYAKRIENEVAQKVRDLKNDFDITPKLVSILVGKNVSSVLYTKLKKQAAQRVGVKFKIKKFNSNTKASEIMKYITQNNLDDKTHGIMVQLPLPANLAQSTKHIVQSIAENKDVDGLREDRGFVHPTVKAILSALDIAVFSGKEKIVVVGSKGMVGSKLIKNYEAVGVDKNTKNLEKITKSADILISCTGVPNLIKKNMVKEGVLIIDVGAPKGDVDKGTYKKAKFVTPVPGGIGPVGISYLLENLAQAAYNQAIIHTS